MLKALLHHKLGRAAFGVARKENDGDGDAEGITPAGLTGLEDPLTSIVFGRLAYLPPDLAWDILRRASQPLGEGPMLPAVPPRGTPSLSFWPTLRPGAGAQNKVRVEPDVLVAWGDTRILIEAKHLGQQDPAQWIEQIRALRASPVHAGKPIWFVAVGGLVTAEAQDQLARVRRELAGDVPGLLTIHWEDLRHVLHALDGPALPAWQSAVVRDMAAALEAWGYRRHMWFSSLPALAARPRAKEALSALRAWSIR